MEAISGLLANRWFLYGAAAVAALGVYYVVAPSSAPSDSGASDAGGYLLPSSAIAPIWGGGGSMGTTSGGGGGMDAASQALVDLEAVKNATTEKLGLAQINSSYAVAMGQQETDQYTAALFADATKTKAATDFASNAMNLLKSNVSAVSGNFKIPGLGSPLTFDLTQIFAGSKKNKGPNNANLGLISQYNSGTISNGINTIPAGATQSGSYAGAPTSSSGGSSAIPIAASASNLGGAQSAALGGISANTFFGASSILAGDAKRNANLGIAA